MSGNGENPYVYSYTFKILFYHAPKNVCGFGSQNHFSDTAPIVLYNYTFQLELISTTFYHSASSVPTFWNPRITLTLPTPFHPSTHLAVFTTCFTFAPIHRYLNNRWCADQNWPHMLFFSDFSASISSAARWNFSLASTHNCTESSYQCDQCENVIDGLVKVRQSLLNLSQSCFYFNWPFSF